MDARIENDFDAYVVVQGNSSQDISDEVTRALEIGFQLYGTLVVRGNTFFQSVVIREDENILAATRRRRAKAIKRKLSR